MNTTSTPSFFRTLIVALFLLTLAIGEGLAQGRQPVTTHPSGPCHENINTSVTKTPWKLSGLGFLRSTSAFDTLELNATSAQLLTAVSGKLTNYTLVIQKAAQLFNYEFNFYGQWIRTVTVKKTGTKCVNNQPVAVNETQTYTEKTPWTHLMGPLVWSDMTPTKMKVAVDKAASALPK